MYEARFVKGGNVKLGNSIWSFNKLAGSGLVCGVKGTCGKHCKGCYDEKDPRRSSCYVFKRYNMYTWDIKKNAVISSHIRNTNIIRKDLKKAFKDLENQIKRARKKPQAIRIHSSGEVETLEEIWAWLELAEHNPSIPFYVYTKAYDIVHQLLSIRPNLPDNFYLNISIWHESGIATYNEWKHIKNVRAFVYIDDYDYSKHDLKMDAMCPAYDKNGKMNHNFTCDKCKICYQKERKVCGCNDH